MLVQGLPYVSLHLCPKEVSLIIPWAMMKCPEKTETTALELSPREKTRRKKGPTMDLSTSCAMPNASSRKLSPPPKKRLQSTKRKFMKIVPTSRPK